MYKAAEEEIMPGPEENMVDVQIYINEKEYHGLISPRLTLLEFLREKMGLHGTKNGCNGSHCGACTVLLDDKAVYSCSLLAVQADHKHVTTIEGLSSGDTLHPIQEAFVEKGAIQCGFCTPGMILAVKDLLDHCPDPTEFEIKEAISGNLCRCTGYTKIIEAVNSAALKLQKNEAS